MNRMLAGTLFIALLAATGVTFLFSCLVTLSDAQGALIFVFTLPVMGALLLLSWFCARVLDRSSLKVWKWRKIPAIFSGMLIVFFLSSAIPVVNLVPSAFLGFLGATFKSITGKTPREFAQKRKDFVTLLARQLDEKPQAPVRFSDLDVTFAWDRVCILGPYTDSTRAKSILNLDIDLKDRSAISMSDSINALVFLYEGKVNKVLDLSRGLVDFKDLDLCIERPLTVFEVSRDANGRRILFRLAQSLEKK